RLLSGWTQKHAASPGLSHQQIREKRGDPGENKEQGRDNDQADEEGVDAAIDHPEGHFGDVFHHEDIDCHRRDNYPDHHGDHDDHGKPDRVEAELQDDRVEDGGGEDHEGEVVD